MKKGVYGWKGTRLLALLCIAIFLVGCMPTKPDGPSSRDELRFANHDKALAVLGKELKENGKDRFLYLAGSGLIKNLHGDYQGSNHNLEEAARLADELQTKSASNMLKVALSSPSSGDYGGMAYERAYIHYYKALNYIMLAAASQGSAREESLEGARIEARRVDILLTEIKNIHGSYEEVEDEKGSTFKKLLKLLRGLKGRTLDPDSLVYREDAYIRYMEGVIYESNGEYDDARIAYQKSAKLYEQGYAKQYLLGKEITEQAWFDTVRMMQWAGGYGDDWPRLADEKLSKQTRERLKLFKKGGAQLLVVNHAGFVPERKEMTLHLRLEGQNKELVVSPGIAGKRENQVDHVARNEQLAWFQALYADRELLSVMSNFYKSEYYGVASGLVEQRISIAPVWELAESIGLVSGMDMMGTFVKVPYYGSTAPDFGRTTVWIDDKNRGELINAESLANIALQEQLLSAGGDLQLALARELTKVVFCSNVGKQLGGGFQGKLAEKACIFGWGSFATADTRNWLTLPHTVQLQRFPLEAGVHNIRLVTQNAGNQGVYDQNEQQIEIKKGEVYLLRNRALSRPVIHQQLAGK